MLKDDFGSKRQLAHQQAVELREQLQFDEAIGLMMEALQAYGPNLSLLVDIAQLFRFQSDFGNYYVYGRKIEQEWIAIQEKLAVETKCTVTLFLSQYFADRGQIARALYYCDLSYRSASTAKQHVLSIATMLNHHAEHNNLKKVNEFYLECLKLTDKAHGYGLEIERALLKAEVRIIGFEQGLYRLEKYLNSFGAVESGFHHMLIDYILIGMVSKYDLSSVREKLFSFLNQINPMELSIFQKVTIQFFDQKNYFLNAQEMSYLQQRFHQAEILDVYHLNSQSCEDEMTQKDLKALFLLMLRESDPMSQQMYRQKYFDEKIVDKKWRLYLHERSQQLVSLDGMMPLKRDEFNFLSVFTSETPTAASQIALQFQTQFEIKELVMRLNQKIYSLIGIPDALAIATTEVKLLESINFSLKK